MFCYVTDENELKEVKINLMGCINYKEPKIFRCLQRMQIFLHSVIGSDFVPRTNILWNYENLNFMHLK